ncbi:DUF721 domain-containing protein [Candidatus Gromoviella agglomerans]|nr:DUF721 domain-containing protein [Candidatus Gromoviella agglomerans]
MQKIIDDATNIPSAIFSSWYRIIPGDLWRFSYPEKVYLDLMYVSIASYKAVFFMHHMREIIDNINAVMGRHYINRITLKQFYYRPVNESKKDIKVTLINQNQDILSSINSVQQDNLRESLMSLYNSMIRK